jgi:hypothetical protein
LEVARLPLSYLRAHGWLRMTIHLLFFSCALLGVRMLMQQNPKNFWRFAAFFILIGIYYWVSRSIKLPEEKLHFFEYGLVGIFFLRALRHHALPRLTLWLGAWVLSSAAGWCDEVLQGMTPTRHYDIRDVRLNVIAAGLGLIAYLICKPTKTR